MFRSTLLARLPRLKQLDDVMVNTEGCNDEEEEEEEEEGDEDNASVNSRNAANDSHRILSGTHCV